MVETAARLIDEVFPQVPVSAQWVLSFPKRLRYFLARDADLLNRVLRIFLDSVRAGVKGAKQRHHPKCRLSQPSFSWRE